MRMAVGGYTGNSVDGQTVTGLGFKPSAVLITCTSTGGDTVFCTADMPATKSGRIRNDVALATGKIKSLDADGFTLGTDQDVNVTGETYQWVAFFDNGLPDFKTFTYTGNGVDNTSITGLGFQPDWVMVKGDRANTGAHCFSTETPGNSSTFYGGAEQTGRIKALQADGIQVGTDSSVNANTTAYYGMAFKADADHVAVLSYVGDATNGRRITAPRFQPRFVLIKQSAGQLPIWWSSNFPATYSVPIAEQAQITNRVQSDPDGFVIYNCTETNQATSTYFALSIGNDNLGGLQNSGQKIKVTDGVSSTGGAF